MSPLNDDIRGGLRQTETQLASKPNYRVWWHRAAAWFVKALFWVIRLAPGDASPRFDEAWTTLGSTIYAPAGHPATLERLSSTDRLIVCEELGHRFDDLEHGWAYRLTYLLSGKARAAWELRGYGMRMVAHYRRTGDVPSDWPRRIAETINGPLYLWAGSADELQAALDTLRTRLLDGTIAASTLNPNDISFFEDHLPWPTSA